MGVVSLKRSVIFIATPGTGSTSLEKALLKIPDFRSFGEKHSNLTETIESIQSELGAEIKKDKFFSFNVVRNPFDWLVAEWWRLRTTYILDLLNEDSYYNLDKNKKRELIFAAAFDFSRWIDVVFRETYKIDVYPGDFFQYWSTQVVRTFKLEDIGVFIGEIEAVIGQRLEVERVNDEGSKRPLPYWSYYSRDARTYVTRMLAETLHRYEYKF